MKRSQNPERVDFEGGRILPEEHKNKRKGKARVAYPPPEALVVLKRLADKHPEGFLFRSVLGNPWNRGTCNDQLRKAGRRAGLPVYSSYDFRHSFATQALAKGLSADMVAELIGNTPAIVSKYYSHLDQKGDALSALTWLPMLAGIPPIFRRDSAAANSSSGSLAISFRELRLRSAPSIRLNMRMRIAAITCAALSSQ